MPNDLNEVTFKMRLTYDEVDLIKKHRGKKLVREIITFLDQDRKRGKPLLLYENQLIEIAGKYMPVSAETSGVDNES